VKSNEECYLCEEESHVEEVPGEHGEYIDVLCFGDCPQEGVQNSVSPKSASQADVMLQASWEMDGHLR
jgi:hypothetical protein